MKMIKLRNWSLVIACTIFFAILFQHELLEWRLVNIVGIMTVGTAFASSVMSARWHNTLHHCVHKGSFSHGPWRIEAVIPALDVVVFEIPGITEPQILGCGPSVEKKFITVMNHAENASIRHSTVLSVPLEVGSYYIFKNESIDKISNGQVREWI